MSITPIISKTPIPYTVFGGSQKARVHKYLFGLSIVVLHRSGRLNRDNALSELAGNRNFEIISIEGPEAAPEIEGLVKKYPDIRFILLHEKSSYGEKINLAIEEAQSKLVLVVWSDMHIPLSSLADRLIEKINDHDILCSVPILKTARHETVPSVQVPVRIKKQLKIVPWNPLRDGMKSIFPFDYVGVYNKEKYRFTGGFDPCITSPYWQKADFGFRSFLWNQEIQVNTSLYFHYRDALAPENQTPDEGYKLFYLKNMSVDFRNDRGHLSIRRFPSYMINSGVGWLRAFREFRQVQKWVIRHKYRYKEDAKSLIELWEPPE
ncbi:MAG: hypothetical protein JW904_05705 [Spirochaetales bacterium]|nr:hypothetical protein [Spirochaetales bacterium]